MARKRIDDEDDDRPRKRRASRDDDDEDDDPRPRRKKAKPAGGSAVWIYVVVGVLAFVGIGVAAMLVLRSKDKANDTDAAQKQGNTDDSEDPLAPIRQKAGGSDPAKPPPGVVAVPAINPSVTHLLFGGGEDGFTALVSISSTGGGIVIDVVKTATGKSMGQVRCKIASNVFAVSPDGSTVAVLDLKPFEGSSIAVYSVSTGQSLREFTPYPKGKNILTPDLSWITYASKDQLLTINSAGGFDLWAVPAMTRTAGVAAPLKLGTRTDANGFTNSPTNFATTADGKTLAMFNGGGFTFYNTRDATEIVRTPNIAPAGTVSSYQAAAFSPDGKRFACHYSLFTAKTNSMAIGIWDAKSGALLKTVAVGKQEPPAGFAWWGMNHVLYWEGGKASATIVSLETGQSVGTVKTTIPGHLGTVPPNGQLWGEVGNHEYDPKKAACYLVRANASATIKPGSAFELTAEGLRGK